MNFHYSPVCSFTYPDPSCRDIYRFSEQYKLVFFAAFFLFFLKDNVMLGHFELQAVIVVRYKSEFVFQKNVS
ncbi:hypothetical protein H206_01339 [Candidatus Electrothrix aarhusensis]|uniref:Uncharacterized protein n=1 Tax=Candidatus Electrothrix aarhusensis TaxID=1859131 RepID=A0A3S3RPM5_9BACT|nr:hypothetical protein H206_01339 [Candidatus Electrothrix aarhusensis]